MRPPAALALAALALSACGGSDPDTAPDRVRAAIADYAAAVKGDDPEQACDVLVTRAQLARSPESRERARDRCRERVGGGRLSAGQTLGDVKVEAVRVRGDGAVARVASGERIELRRVDGAWRIVAPG